MNIYSYLSPSLFDRSNSNLGSDLEAIAAHSENSTCLKSILPCLRPRDEAIFWMTAAAEVEHFLMTHYLFAAYSLSPEQGSKIETLQNTLLQIAREEMGHLITVQNLLTLLGAPLHFGREHSPYASEVYPFRFRLERVSLDSLAKYTLAESPVDREMLKEVLSEADFELFDSEISRRAIASNDGRPVRNVGPIFARLRQLFAEDLGPDDLRLDRAGRQARWADWGYKPSPGGAVGSDLKVLVHHFDQTNFEEAKKAAIDAIQEIGDQGEEADKGIGNGESHFERFFESYKLLVSVDVNARNAQTWPVVSNPNVTLSPPPDSERSMLDSMLQSPMQEGRITNPRTRAWAHLFNLRYRLLLRFLNHALVLDGPVFVQDGLTQGDRTTKGTITYWAFKEMRRVKKLAEKLVQMPLGEDLMGLRAGPPFELPYQLNISTEEIDRWAAHAEVIDASIKLTGEIIGSDPDADDAFLAHLLADDVNSSRIAKSFAQGVALPEDDYPTEFGKVAHILDEAVRGFPVINFRHPAFWQNITRDEFLNKAIEPIVAGDPDASKVVQRIEQPEENSIRMPYHRPRIDKSRLNYIRDWVQRGAPDSTPPDQIGIASEPKPATEIASLGEVTQAVFSAAQAPGFEKDIKPLFREFPDRTSMLFAFDLHNYDHVKQNAKRIFETLFSGSMPCTGRWPKERIQLFKTWMDKGFKK